MAYLSHCADRGNFPEVCLRTYVKGWRRVRDICDDLEMVCETLVNRSRRVSDAWEDFVIPCERFATVRNGLANRFANPAQIRRIQVRTEELCNLICTFVFIYVYDVLM